MKNIIEIKNVSFAYGKEVVLRNINLDVEEKDFLGIIGPNGSGKTTLLKLILGFLKPDKGTVSIDGLTPSKARHKIGYVPQYRETDKNFPIKTREVVEMGLAGKTTFFFRLAKGNSGRIDEIIDSVGLTSQAELPFGELSGGQQQRCLIARALASDPDILLMDEPTASVDNTVEKDIFELLKNLNKSKTILLVSHDIGFISNYLNKVACVNKELVCHKTSEVSRENILKEVYNDHFSSIQHKCGL